MMLALTAPTAERAELVLVAFCAMALLLIGLLLAGWYYDWTGRRQ